MARIEIDLKKNVKPMKPMHGCGQPPFLGASDEMVHYLTDAGIPYSRLHDVGGLTGTLIFLIFFVTLTLMKTTRQVTISYLPTIL